MHAKTPQDYPSGLEKRSLVCIVPARNEAGHLGQIIKGIRSIQEITQIVIVEGGSNDGTFEIGKKLAEANPETIFCIKQSGKGKFNAVIEGAALLESDFTIVWDADGTVPVESTQQLIDLSLKTGSFLIGDRLRGQIEPGAMQKANKIGNWFFGIAWAPLLRIKPTDIFCGTKIGPSRIFLNTPEYFKKHDPYGDIALLLTARLMRVKIESVSVTYTARVYGESKMRRWRMGLRFLKLTVISYKHYFLKNVSLDA